MDNIDLTESTRPKNIDRNKSQLLLLIGTSLLLVAIIFSLYWRVTSFEFINFDDPLYIVDNPHVKKGFSIESIKWAFHLSRSGDQYYWQPMTFLSHMADCELFGLKAGMHHLSNVVFHTLNTLLIFFVLWLYTRSTSKSIFVAILFAMHPVNVDSVAWIAERKNLLSTFFWMLVLLTYYFYAKKPNLDRYLIVLLLFILGLLSKPMLVTLPFVLLLLDFWPLNRVTSKGDNIAEFIKSIFTKHNFKLVMEKLPLIIISLASGVYSTISMSKIGVFISNEIVPMDLRIKNAVVSYVHYIIKMFWPVNLTFYYPFPKDVPMWQVLGSVLIIVVITVMAFKYIKRLPYLFFGWFWYIGTLVPVLGIIQGGLWPQIAERWAYIPYIGLFIILSWGIPDLLNKVLRKGIIIWASALAVIVTLSVSTWAQIGYWKDDFVFFGRALQINSQNVLAHINLGNALSDRKHDVKGAIWHYKEAIRIEPTNAMAYYNLALIYSHLDDKKLAIENYEKLMVLNPYFPNAIYNYGVYLTHLGRTDEALKKLYEAIKLDPFNAKAHYFVGLNLAKLGKTDEAMKRYQEALKIDPNNNSISNALGQLLAISGNSALTMNYFRNVLKSNPKDAKAHSSLGLVLTRSGNLDEAEKHFNEALKIDPRNVDAIFGTGLVFEKRGKFDEAINKYQEALKIEPKNINIYSQLGLALLGSGKVDEAIMNFKKVIEISPGNAIDYYVLGNIMMATGRTDDAVKQFEEAIRIAPDYADSYIDLGNILLKKGFIDQAIRRFTSALKIDPHRAQAFNGLGTAYFNKGNLKKAIECYQAAVKEKPDYSLAIQNLKTSRINWNNYETLLTKTQDAIRANPQNHDLYTKLGDVYRQMGEYDQAIMQYRKALSIKPQYSKAMYGLVLVYSDGVEDFAKAIDLLQNMKQSQPGNPEIYYNIACIYAKQNRVDESIVWLKQSIEKGFRNWDQLQRDPDLFNIRDTYYMKQLIANKGYKPY